MKYFFFYFQTKNSLQKNETKGVYWAVIAKTTTST